MKTRLILMFTLTLLFSACAAPNTPQPIETIIPTNEIASTPEPTLPPAQTEPAPTSGNLPGMQTYTDDLAGFSLDYPVDWFVESSALLNAEQGFAYTVGIATWNIRNPPTPSGKDSNALPEGGTKIDVTVMTADHAGTGEHSTE